MEQKHSEQAPMSVGWYINEIKRLEAEVARLTALIQPHQTRANTPTKPMEDKG